MTRKLYDLKPYDTHFQARVQSCTIVNQQTLLILDQTLFFPEEGGQCADQGTINGIDVTAVMIADEIITHTLKGIHHFAIGEQVEGIIDWPMRFSNMQNHSAEHIFSGIVHQRYGYDNVGFHLGLEEVTVDFNGVIPERDLLDIEQAVNEAIYQNVPITAAYYTHEEAAKLSYRSKKDIPGAIRLVEIAGYDLCACCAPHVRQSGEIGLFKILRCDNYKQGVRCSILAGRRALQYLQVDFCHLTSLYQLLSANQTSIVTHVNRIYQENGMLKKQLREAETK
ncbi:MAG: alanyl-tRNA editing protein, partial [bacterium]